MTAHSLLRRLAIDVDEREFADTIELAEDVWASLEWMEHAAGVPQSRSDEGREVRRIIGFQEQIDSNPVAADVAARIMRHGNGAHFALRRHDDGDQPRVHDDPTTA